MEDLCRVHHPVCNEQQEWTGKCDTQSEQGGLDTGLKRDQSV